MKLKADSLFGPSLRFHYRNFIATTASADFSSFVVTTLSTA